MTDPITQVNKDLAELDQAEAEADRNRAEARLFEVQTEQARHVARYQELNTAGTERAHAWNLASDGENRIYHMCGVIDSDLAHHCQEFLTRWARQDIGEPVEIKMTTPGGSAWDGMALFDEIRALRNKGLHVTITVRGTAASMGAILLQAADVRRMGPSSTLMIHKLSGGAIGSLDQIEDVTAWYKIIQDQAYDIFEERCAASGAPKPLSRRQIINGMARKDWALGPAECLELGLIDAIG